MPKKKLLNRLENLLTDLGQEASFLPISGDKSLPGWSWECDDQGIYLVCSPEVEDILGIRRQVFLGQPLTSFAIHPDSSSILEAALAAGQFPAEVYVQFLCSTGEGIPTRLN